MVLYGENIMPTARKTKSGKWRCQAFDHIEIVDGKKKYIHQSFTARTKYEAERMANEFLRNKGRKSSELKLDAAIDKYLEIKSNSISPSTIRGYRSLQRNAYKSLLNVRIDRITSEEAQECINDYAPGHSAKTLRNAVGLLVAVITTFIPDSRIHVTVPVRSVPEYYTPTDDDIDKLMGCFTNPKVYRAALLAAFGTLRRSEICGLKKSDISGNVVTIRRVLVSGPEGWEYKNAAKNETSQRRIIYPDFVIKVMESVEDEYLVKMNPNNLSRQFTATVKKAGLPHFRLHDLRAFSASIAHAIGIPDVYTMERGGWKTDATFKAVYRRSISDKQKEYSDQLNEYFRKLHS